MQLNFVVLLLLMVMLQMQRIKMITVSQILTMIVAFVMAEMQIWIVQVFASVMHI